MKIVCGEVLSECEGDTEGRGNYTSSVYQHVIYCTLGDTSPHKPTLRQLLTMLKPVTAEWRVLGVHLCIDAGKLDAIRAANPHKVEDCTRDLVNHWLQKYPNKGWRDIVIALREMGRNDVAGEIEKQYIPSQGTYVHSTNSGWG